MENQKNKWNDPLYHSMEFMRELSAAEQHLIQYINIHDKDEVLASILTTIREIRKKTEDDIYGRE